MANLAPLIIGRLSALPYRRTTENIDIGIADDPVSLGEMLRAAMASVGFLYPHRGAFHLADADAADHQKFPLTANRRVTAATFGVGRAGQCLDRPLIIGSVMEA
jgi:hypothetical protein